MSQTGSFTISPAGSVVTSGAMSLQTPVLADIKACLPDSHFIDNDSNHAIIVTQRDSTDVNPANLSLIPLAPFTGQSTEVKIPFSALSSKFSSEISELALYSPSFPGPRFVSTSTETFETALRFGGSQWMAAPVYKLDNSDVKITMLTPHAKIDTPSALPTPPPSPPLIRNANAIHAHPGARRRGTCERTGRGGTCARGRGTETYDSTCRTRPSVSKHGHNAPSVHFLHWNIMVAPGDDLQATRCIPIPVPPAQTTNYVPELKCSWVRCFYTTRTQRFVNDCEYQWDSYADYSRDWVWV